MIVTEEEAKTKRCQESFGPVSAPTICNAPIHSGFYSHGMAGGPSSGAYGYAPPILNCIGSACMAWRWGREDLIETIGTGSMVLIKPGQGEYSATHGFCGKAGKP